MHRASVFVPSLMVAALAAQHDPSLRAPVRLEADGLPIDMVVLCDQGHAGPALGDVDGDGDLDLLVGDFVGTFWLFENLGTRAAPEFTNRGQLRVEGKKRGDLLRVRSQ